MLNKISDSDSDSILYSLCMEFQVELKIFKINLKIVFCVKHFISSELQPSVTN